MSDNFIGEIRAFSFNWAPQGWALCDGATLQIAQNSALYSLLGVQFGGDGKTTFKLPDLRGRTPAYGGSYQGLAAAGGQETVTVSSDKLPPHTHSLYATADPATSTSGAGTILAATGANPIYSAAAATGALASASVSSVGGSSAHENMQPFTVVNFCIAVTGLYPMRS